MDKKQKIIALIITIIIILGTVVTLVSGLNYDLRFQQSKRIELYLEKDFNISDIKKITDETLENKNVIIQKVEVYSDTVRIIAKDITEEQKQNLVNKVNEKYGTEISADDVEITSIPNTRGRDLIKPYILPFSISTIIILVYFAVRYIKLGSLKILLRAILEIVITQLTLLSTISITRIPVGRLTMPMVITVYLLTLVFLSANFEKQLKDKKEKDKEEFSE